MIRFSRISQRDKKCDQPHRSANVAGNVRRDDARRMSQSCIVGRLAIRLTQGACGADHGKTLRIRFVKIGLQVTLR